jgi:hypothetical protein
MLSQQNAKMVRDKNGQEVQPFDLLKVYHYIDRKRTVNYMYKWVRERYGKLVCYHLSSDLDGDFYRLDCHKLNENGLCVDIEIIQSPMTLMKLNKGKL